MQMTALCVHKLTTTLESGHIPSSGSVDLWMYREMHPLAKKGAAAVACLVYMTISSGLIVLNQQLMNEDGFRYPMALSGLGMGFSAVASYIACKVTFQSLTLDIRPASVMLSVVECLQDARAQGSTQIQLLLPDQ